jgi:hypothetical protein
MYSERGKGCWQICVQREGGWNVLAHVFWGNGKCGLKGVLVHLCVERQAQRWELEKEPQYYITTHSTYGQLFSPVVMGLSIT